jgi:DNA polymerase I-like protein with 3'-5' exonuclease and polymerase domains
VLRTKKLKHPVIESFKKFTKASKLVSFGRKMFNYIEKEDGRIHAGFSQLVPTGSRMSSSKPNMQQLFYRAVQKNVCR